MAKTSMNRNTNSGTFFTLQVKGDVGGTKFFRACSAQEAWRQAYRHIRTEKGEFALSSYRPKEGRRGTWYRDYPCVTRREGGITAAPKYGIEVEGHFDVFSPFLYAPEVETRHFRSTVEAVEFCRSCNFIPHTHWVCG